MSYAISIRDFMKFYMKGCSLPPCSCNFLERFKLKYLPFEHQRVICRMISAEVGFKNKDFAYMVQCYNVKILVDNCSIYFRQICSKTIKYTN